MNLTTLLHAGKPIKLYPKQLDNSDNIMKARIEEGYSDGKFSILLNRDQLQNFSFPVNNKGFIIVEDHSNPKPKVYKINVNYLKKVKQDNTLKIILQKTGTPKKIERRTYYRLEIIKTFTYKYEDTTGDLLIKDISISGLRAIVNKYIKPNAKLEVFLNLATEKNPEILTLKAQVITCNKVPNSLYQHDIGLKFINISQKNTDRLSQYIVSEQTRILHSISEQQYKLGIKKGKKNLRHREDPLVSSIPVLGMLSWFFTLVTVVLFLDARPEQVFNFDIFFNIQTRKFWDANFLRYTIISASLELVFCAISLFINSLRHKRKEDTFHKGLIFNFIISLFALLTALFLLFTY